MVEVTRNGFTESSHHGVAVLINSSGEILREWGDSDILVYPRSALKPIQSLNLYKDGVAEGLNLSDNFIALTTASHHAENIHQKMIFKWLKNPSAYCHETVMPRLRLNDQEAKDLTAYLYTFKNIEFEEQESVDIDVQQLVKLLLVG